MARIRWHAMSLSQRFSFGQLRLHGRMSPDERDDILGTLMRLTCGRPKPAVLFAVARPRLTRHAHDGSVTKVPLRWGANEVECKAGDRLHVELPYMGMRIGRAEHEITSADLAGGELQYRAPWHIMAGGELGSTARSRGGATVALLMAVLVLLPAAAIAVATVLAAQTTAELAEELDTGTSGVTAADGELPADPEPVLSYGAHTYPGQLAARGRVNIGIKDDVPGISDISADGTASGFDVAIAEAFAADLGLASDQIQWVPVTSDGREAALLEGTVDLVLATWTMGSIQDIGSVEVVGPYYVDRQHLLVPSGSEITTPDSAAGQRVCSITGSTMQFAMEQYRPRTVARNSLQECVAELLAGQVEAVTGTGLQLLSYAHQHPDQIRVTEAGFGEELRYGVGIPAGAPMMCEAVQESLSGMFADGRWATAFNDAFGLTGDQAPRVPAPEPCP